MELTKYFRTLCEEEGGGGGKGGGGGGGGGTTYVPQYTAPQAAPDQTAASTQDLATTPEEEAKKIKEAQKVGAKSLQIPLMDTGATTTSTVGKV